MDAVASAVLARLPLAEAVLTAWHWMADDGFLDDFYVRHRGRTYTRLIGFPVLVRLMHDVLVGAAPSAHRRLTQAVGRGELPASIQAAYKKLSRLPLPLSMAFVADCTERLREAFPAACAVELPACIANWEPVILDGKAIKRVAKRLQPLRGVRGGVLGGRALVAEALSSGLVLALHGDPDGEANDLRFVPDLLPVVRGRIGRPILWIADRQFGYPEVLTQLGTEADRFVVRYHGNVCFTPVAGRPAQTGTDATGRGYHEAWGWLGGVQNPHRQLVRRITLDRPGEAPIVLVTNLLDADAYPAAAVLRLYQLRWGIERVFQQVTEVFGLAGLIGGTPEATVFQFAVCLVLYNLIQLMRATVARAGRCTVEAVSGEKLFQDVTAELVAWRTLVSVEETLSYFATVPTIVGVRRRLHQLLGLLWRDDWLKAPAKKRRPANTPETHDRGQHRAECVMV